MDENNVTNNSVDNGYLSDSSDSMLISLMKLVFVVLIGGLVVKYFRKFVNWVKEGKRLREEDKERKAEALIEVLAEKKAQEKVDAIMAQQVKEKEESEKDSNK